VKGLTKYAVLQATLELPEVGRLQRAFASLPGFTAADAPILANDAFGILVKNLDAQAAAAFQGALRSEGIGTELVPMSALPPLPPAKSVRRLACGRDALLVFDPLGRSFPVEWQHVMLVAAGNARVREFRPVTKLVRAPLSGRDPLDQPALQPQTHRREESIVKPLLEIILARGVQRFSVEVDRLLFEYLGARKQAEAWANLTLVVRDLLEHAPHALANRGAFHLQQEPPTGFDYPSKNAFFEEIIWMLWKMKG